MLFLLPTYMTTHIDDFVWSTKDKNCRYNYLKNRQKSMVSTGTWWLLTKKGPIYLIKGTFSKS